jgi:hypothetical protein
MGIPWGTGDSGPRLRCGLGLTLEWIGLARLSQFTSHQN